MKRKFKDPPMYKPGRPRKPRPKKTGERCPQCKKRLTDFELIYGCAHCGLKQNR